VPLLPLNKMGDLWVAHLSVDGMTCAACSSTVTRAFSVVSGVKNVSVSLLLGKAEVRYAPSSGDDGVPSRLVAAGEAVGFDVALLSAVPEASAAAALPRGVGGAPPPSRPSLRCCCCIRAARRPAPRWLPRPWVNCCSGCSSCAA